jgi:hypothetical protein
MNQYVVQRRFQSPLATGIAASAICFVITLVYWPIWGILAKAIITSFAGQGLREVDANVSANYIKVFAEGVFFWLVINAWIWQTLIFGNYGKTRLTERQPWAGIWYSAVAFASGTAGFLVLVGFLGIWWKPFNFAVLFCPKNAEEVKLAIEGWEVTNFYALAVILAQIPFVSLFQKWPFANNIKSPWDGYGVMMASTVAALLVWFAMIIPSLMKLSLGEHAAVVKPMGSWPTFVASCQAFIWLAILPAEGGEQYPMKLFARKQPYMAFSGLAVALVMAFAVPALLRSIVGPLDLLPGAPVDLVVASLLLSLIVVTLLWHHLFDDFPSAQRVPNQTARILIRIAIWMGLAGILGITWLKTFKSLPFGANDFGLGFPTMGVLAGQFAFLMPVLYFNTFFDKWPLVRKVAAEVDQPREQALQQKSVFA